MAMHFCLFPTHLTSLVTIIPFRVELIQRLPSVGGDNIFKRASNIENRILELQSIDTSCGTILRPFQNQEKTDSIEQK